MGIEFQRALSEFCTYPTELESDLSPGKPSLFARSGARIIVSVNWSVHEIGVN